MKIQEASQKSGLSADTIRYYEKQGFLPEIARDASGHRRFSQADVDWMNVLYWLRKTGMPMRMMAHYARLVHQGDHTAPQRIEILQEHREILTQKRADLDRCDELLDYKLSCYLELNQENENGKHQALE